MSQSKGKLIIVALVFAVLAMSSLACGGSSDVAAATEIEPTPDPVQAKHAAMENAYELGETLFIYDAPQGDSTYALFYGKTRVIFLKEGNLRGVKLTTQESINLTVKTKEDGEDWWVCYSFSSLGVGDYVYYDGIWRVTHYTP